MSYLRRRFKKKKRHHYNVESTSCLKRCWNQVEIALQLRWNQGEIMTLKQISYETFYQRRFNVSLPFFNVVSTLKQRRCACWEELKEIAEKDLSGKRGKISISARGFIREWWPDQVVIMLLSISSLVRSSQTCFIQTVSLISDQGSYNMKALPHYHLQFLA